MRHRNSRRIQRKLRDIQYLYKIPYIGFVRTVYARLYLIGEVYT
jgi:hypothetical protein